MTALARQPWRNWLRAGRDRLLTSPRFQRWASASPLTRPIARRHAHALFDLCAGFVYSQVLFACVQLRVFERLARGPTPAPRLAQECSIPPSSMARLLQAAAALRLVEDRGPPGFGLGPLGAVLLGQSAVRAMIEHHALLYADLRDPVALLRNRAGETALARYWAYARCENPSDLPGIAVDGYSELMAATQSLVGGEVLDAYDFGRHRCLLDVGGGDGGFVVAVARRTPQLRLMLFDLPAVAARARARFAECQLGGRATATGGDFMRDALPAGADVATLLRVLHDHDDEAAAALLRAVARVLPQDGTLLLAEPMADVPGAEPIGGAYFGLYLLAMGSGRPRTRRELEQMLRANGYDRVRPLRARSPVQACVLIARRARSRGDTSVKNS